MLAETFYLLVSVHVYYSVLPPFTAPLPLFTSHVCTSERLSLVFFHWGTFTNPLTYIYSHVTTAPSTHTSTHMALPPRGLQCPLKPEMGLCSTKPGMAISESMAP